MRFGLLSTHMGKITVNHTSLYEHVFGITGRSEVPRMHAGTGEEWTERTISLFSLEQILQLMQINLTWLPCYWKKNSNKIQHCWNLMPAQYLLSWVICSIQSLPLHESHPCKRRLVSITERIFLLTVLAGTWCKTVAPLPYLSGISSYCFEEPIHEHVLSHSASLPLSEPWLNPAITPPHHFSLKLAELYEAQDKTCRVLLG